MPQYYSIDRFVDGRVFSIMKQTSLQLKYLTVKKIITEEETFALRNLHAIQSAHVGIRSFMREEFCKLFDLIEQSQQKHQFEFRWTNTPSTTAKQAWSHVLGDMPHQFANHTFVGSVPLLDKLPDSSIGEKTQLELYKKLTRNDTTQSD
jgi:hypothetical protein